jgi:hypothetical protein
MASLVQIICFRLRHQNAAPAQQVKWASAVTVRSLELVGVANDSERAIRWLIA